MISINAPAYPNSRTYDRNIENQMAKDYVKELNSFYHRTIFKEGSQFQGLNFKIKEFRQLPDFCQNCNLTAEEFLAEFSKLNTSKFCLAHLFTYRHFPEKEQVKCL